MQVNNIKLLSTLPRAPQFICQLKCLIWQTSARSKAVVWGANPHPNPTDCTFAFLYAASMDTEYRSRIEGEAPHQTQIKLQQGCADRIWATNLLLYPFSF